MNWEKGFFRFWVVLTILWVLGWWAYAIWSIAVPKTGINWLWVLSITDLKMLSLSLIGGTFFPPTMVFALGYAVLWVMRGFRSGSPPKG